MFSSTEPLLAPRRVAITESVIEVTMKAMAAYVVARLSTVPAVRVPKAVWLPAPPKAAAMSALCPCCSSTTTIRKAQTKTWITVTRPISMNSQLSLQVLAMAGQCFAC